MYLADKHSYHEADSFEPIINEPTKKAFEEEMDLNVLKPSLSDVIHSEEFLQNILCTSPTNIPITKQIVLSPSSTNRRRKRLRKKWI
mmetsp:Transcript_26675/g.39464  ORF Transcript_26675/g.39464 Transcript_26675/m.39464 type:complete len:87 (-) Transcript_26675:2-262(-)